MVTGRLVRLLILGGRLPYGWLIFVSTYQLRTEKLIPIISLRLHLDNLLDHDIIYMDEA